MASYARTWAEIDLNRLTHNLKQVRSLLPDGVKLLLVTKADAYGHGLVPVSRWAVSHGADWVGVATVGEAVSLREAEIDAPVIVLSPILEEEAKLAAHYDLRVTVERPGIAAALSAAAERKRIAVHLKVDTGMARFGVPLDRVVETACEIADLPNIVIEGLCSHFAWSAGDPEFTRLQYARFQQAVADLAAAGISPPVKHIANTGAVVKHPNTLEDMARVGILAYGIAHVEGHGLDLRRVLTWKSRVMALRRLQPGAKVGYNSTYTVDRESVIATVGIGYGDGYHRLLGNAGHMSIRGARAPVRGLVCMDQTMIDVTDISGVEVGDEVGLLDDTTPAEDLAKVVKTTPHEMTTRIMARVPRTYIH